MGRGLLDLLRAWLRWLAELLLRAAAPSTPEAGADNQPPAEWLRHTAQITPPEHWLEHVRARAPHLLESGALGHTPGRPAPVGSRAPRPAPPRARPSTSAAARPPVPMRPGLPVSRAPQRVEQRPPMPRPAVQPPTPRPGAEPSTIQPRADLPTDAPRNRAAAGRPSISLNPRALTPRTTSIVDVRERAGFISSDASPVQRWSAAPPAKPQPVLPAAPHLAVPDTTPDTPHDRPVVTGDAPPQPQRRTAQGERQTAGFSARPTRPQSILQPRRLPRRGAPMPYVRQLPSVQPRPDAPRTLPPVQRNNTERLLPARQHRPEPPTPTPAHPRPMPTVDPIDRFPVLDPFSAVDTEDGIGRQVLDAERRARLDREQRGE